MPASDIEPVSSSAIASEADRVDAHAGEVRKLSTLLEASQALLRERSLKAGLRQVLGILGHHHGAIGSSVVILNEQTREVDVETSVGIEPDTAATRAFSDRMTGQVLQTGHPMVVAQV